MKTVTKILFLDEQGEKFFGEGPSRLLHGIEKYGSLRSAAASMDMAYSKALKIIKNAEQALGFSLTTRTTGGKDGGGSVLTLEGKAWLQKYDNYKTACNEVNYKLIREHFPKVGCVIMASGMSKRFGINKLMAEFNDAPMVLQALKATEHLFSQCIVVTRHKEVAKFCEDYGVKVLLHDLPYRSDTIRLGLEALGDLDACMFLPSDQPLIRKETIFSLIQTWENAREYIVRPACDGIPGSPVLFPSWSFSELLTLPEGKGGNFVIQKHLDQVKNITISNPYELTDADTPEVLNTLRRQIAIQK